MISAITPVNFKGNSSKKPLNKGLRHGVQSTAIKPVQPGLRRAFALLIAPLLSFAGCGDNPKPKINILDTDTLALDGGVDSVGDTGTVAKLDGGIDTDNTGAKIIFNHPELMSQYTYGMNEKLGADIGIIETLPDGGVAELDAGTDEAASGAGASTKKYALEAENLLDFQSTSYTAAGANIVEQKIGTTSDGGTKIQEIVNGVETRKFTIYPNDSGGVTYINDKTGDTTSHYWTDEIEGGGIKGIKGDGTEFIFRNDGGGVFNTYRIEGDTLIDTGMRTTNYKLTFTKVLDETAALIGKTAKAAVAKGVEFGKNLDVIDLGRAVVRRV